MTRVARWDSRLGQLKRVPACVLWTALGARIRSPRQVVHIVEAGDWVIRRIGRRIAAGVTEQPFRFMIDMSPRFFRNTLIHFGSISTFVTASPRSLHPSNRCLATMYHGNRHHSRAMDQQIDAILAEESRLDRIIVSNSIMHQRLIGWGIPEPKLSLIPIGVELQAFRDEPTTDRHALRREHGIPADAVCVGSFQKDGNGWGEGLEPKLIKGPDVFVQVVRRLAQQHKVHCLLTGPARGYVKSELERAGIPYTHRFQSRYEDVVSCYRCLDLYLVTSREEGGPMAVMESMAAGVPLVSTRVGMADDLIRNGENGFLVDVDDVESLAGCADRLISDESLRRRLTAAGRDDVVPYDWSVIVAQLGQLYAELLQR